MDRPSFESIYMSLAEAMSKRSTCKRLQVGTVMVTTDFRKVLAVGYNGAAAGLPHACNPDAPGACGDVHSEQNAIVNCDSPRYIEKYVFVTHSPCLMCATMLINLGNVLRVYYKIDYRDTTPLQLLGKAGISVIKMD